MNAKPAEYVHIDSHRNGRQRIAYADVLYPGKHPVILTHGVYGKRLPIVRLRHRLFKLANSISVFTKHMDHLGGTLND